MPLWHAVAWLGETYCIYDCQHRLLRSFVPFVCFVWLWVGVCVAARLSTLFTLSSVWRTNSVVVAFARSLTRHNQDTSLPTQPGPENHTHIAHTANTQSSLRLRFNTPHRHKAAQSWPNGRSPQIGHGNPRSEKQSQTQHIRQERRNGATVRTGSFHGSLGVLAQISRAQNQHDSHSLCFVLSPRRAVIIA